MKRLNETMIFELFNELGITVESDYIEVEIYSKDKYGNCDDNIMIASFISLERIGSWLLTQKITAYKVIQVGKINRIEIYCKDI